MLRRSALPLLLRLAGGGGFLWFGIIDLVGARPAVGTVELVGGTVLLAGIFVQVAALALAGTMVAVLSTSGLVVRDAVGLVAALALLALRPRRRTGR